MTRETKPALEAHEIQWPEYEAKLFNGKHLLNAPVTQLLLAICQYTRGAGSRGEHLFREKLLVPYLEHWCAQHGRTLETDDYGNLWVCHEANKHQTLFVAHVDSVHDENCPPFQQVKLDSKGELSLEGIPVSSRYEFVETTVYSMGQARPYRYKVPRTPSFKQCLGADDAAGIAVMMHLLRENAAVDFLFVRDEEVGCLGSKWIVDNHPEFLQHYRIAIQIDRKGTDEIIGEMSVGKTASRAFAEQLSGQMGMNHAYSTKGSITDVGQMTGLIEECVNLAAGYERQHSEKETCDTVYLEALAKQLIIVRYNELTAERDLQDTVRERDMQRRNNVTNFHGYGYQSRMFSQPSRNRYGDYSGVDHTNDVELLGENSQAAMERFVRLNTGFISAFLMASDISPAEMAEAILFFEAQQTRWTLSDSALELEEEDTLDDGQTINWPLDGDLY